MNKCDKRNIKLIKNKNKYKIKIVVTKFGIWFKEIIIKFKKDCLLNVMIKF